MSFKGWRVGFPDVAMVAIYVAATTSTTIARNTPVKKIPANLFMPVVAVIAQQGKSNNTSNESYQSVCFFPAFVFNY